MTTRDLDESTIQELLRVIELGIKARKAQKWYFKGRSRDALNESIAREREFDAKAAQIMERYKGSAGDDGKTT